MSRFRCGARLRACGWLRVAGSSAAAVRLAGGLVSAGLSVGLACATAAAAATPTERALPAIVFVSRLPPIGADSGQVPGLGPRGTFAGRGGRLLERASDGTVRELLPAGRLFDVADPCVSDDGKRVAFSARETLTGRWNIWSVLRAGGEPRRLTDSHGDGQSGYTDPLWWGDTLLFVGSFSGHRAWYDGSTRTQLFAMAPGGATQVLTVEPNGVLDPAASPSRDRLWFSRWWFNPWRAIPGGLAPVATDDSVNQWQAVSARLARAPDGRMRLEDVRIAAGGALPRRRGMALQSAPLADGGAFAVAARNMGLAPRPGPLAVLRFPPPPAAGVRWSGAAIADEAGDTYSGGSNLAPPAAVAPVALADGRVVLSLDPGGRGEYGLVLVSADGESHETLVDEPGVWELDAAVVPEGVSGRSRGTAASATRRSASPSSKTFRYLSRDVFAGDGAPARQDGVELHVYRKASGDSAARIRSVRVARSGRVSLQLPADTPLFEVLVAAGGGALATPHGPAQVRGANSGAAGTTSRCSGCHLGHSARP